MKRALRLFMLGVIVLAIGYVVYGRRAQIEAKIWHWRHGNSVNVGAYIVPVPDQWLVFDYEDPTAATLIDTRVHKTPDPLSAVDVITVIALSSPARDLDFWASFQRQWLERSGLRDIMQRTLQADDEVLICLGGYQFRDALKVPNSTAVSLECQSSGRLSLIFSGHASGLPEFYSIASQIRKRK